MTAPTQLTVIAGGRIDLQQAFAALLCERRAVGMEEVHFPAEFGALAVQLQHAADGVVKAAHDADVAHKAVAKDRIGLTLSRSAASTRIRAHTAAAAGVFKRFHHKIDADVRAQRFERGDNGRRIRAPGARRAAARTR